MTTVANRLANAASLPRLDDWPEGIPKPAGVDVERERTFYVVFGSSDVESDERFSRLWNVTDPVEVLRIVWAQYPDRIARLYPKQP